VTFITWYAELKLGLGFLSSPNRRSWRCTCATKLLLLLFAWIVLSFGLPRCRLVYPIGFLSPLGGALTASSCWIFVAPLSGSSTVAFFITTISSFASSGSSAAIFASSGSRAELVECLFWIENRRIEESSSGSIYFRVDSFGPARLSRFGSTRSTSARLGQLDMARGSARSASAWLAPLDWVASAQLRCPSRLISSVFC
jgi:hypothetical protein